VSGKGEAVESSMDPAALKSMLAQRSSDEAAAGGSAFFQTFHDLLASLVGPSLTERFRRPTFDHLQIDLTVEDAKAYTKPWTVRLDQRFLPDEEIIEFVCNENQQFRRRIKID